MLTVNMICGQYLWSQCGNDECTVFLLFFLVYFVCFFFLFCMGSLIVYLALAFSILMMTVRLSLILALLIMDHKFK